MTKLRPIMLALCLSAPIVGTLTPTVSFAQSRDDIRAAKERFKAGKQLYKDGKYAEAAVVFKEAYELSQRAELLYNIGQAYRLAGELREAEKHLQQYLAESPQADNADQVVQQIVELQQQIAAELATVQIETAVPGRSVFVDSETQPRCSTPCSVTVPPGPRKLTIRGEGALDLVEEIALEPGKTFQIKTQLQPAIAMGSLLILTDRPAGTLAVGERRTGLPLERPMEVEAGEYAVTVESARNARWSGQVKVLPNETTELFVPMQSVVEARRRGSLRKSLAYGLWGVGAASAAGGLLLGKQTRDTYDQLETQDARSGSVEPALLAQGQNQQLGANIMFAVAGTAVVTGIALFVWDVFASEKDPTPPPSESLAQK